MTPTKTDSALRDKVAVRAEQGADKKPTTIVELINDMKPQIARALPTSMSVERFTRVTLTELRRNPALLDCKAQSLLGCIMLSAQLGLEFGPLGHAYMVPFAKEATFIIGYKGLIDLARRSGNIESLVAREVHKNDRFEFEYGLDEKLVHVPNFEDPGDVIAYYAVAKYVGGGHTIMVMSPADIEKRRQRSRAKDNGPWKTDFDAMAKKTCIRAMSSFLPMSIEMARAIEADETVATYRDDVIDITPSELDAAPDDGGEANSTAAAPVGTPAPPGEPAQEEPGAAETPASDGPGSSDSAPPLGESS